MRDLATVLQGDFQGEVHAPLNRLKTAVFRCGKGESDEALREVALAAEELATLMRQWAGLGTLIPPDGMTGDEYAPTIRAAVRALAEFFDDWTGNPIRDRCRAALREVAELAEGTGQER